MELTPFERFCKFLKEKVRFFFSHSHPGKATGWLSAKQAWFTGRARRG